MDNSAKDFAESAPASFVTVNSSRSRSGPAAVIADLWEGWRAGPIWRAFAWDEIQHRYRRSALGLAWIVISYLVFVGAISLFFGGFSSMGGAGFTSYAAVGYAAFTFLVGNVTDGCQVFRVSATWIKSSSLPYSVYVYKSIARSLFPFAIQVAVSFAVMAAMGWRPHWGALMAAPALVLYLVNAVWVQLFFGLVAARWRDISHLTAAITRVLFFLTPILWVYDERTGVTKRIAELNPFTHFLEIFRAPILGQPLPADSWLFALAWTAAGWALAITAASFMRRRLPFWV